MGHQVVTTTVKEYRVKKPKKKKIPELDPKDVQEIPTLKKSGKGNRKRS